MDLLGKKVNNNAYGNGIIVKQDDSHIDIQFEKIKEIKTYVYPSCFQKFLKLADSDLAAQIDETLVEINRQKQLEEQQKAEKEAAALFAKKAKEPALKSKKSVVLHPFGSVESFCEEFKKAIIGEIVYLKETGGKHYHIFDGKRLEVKSGKCVYTFESDEELHFPDGTQISIWKDQTSIPGQVLGCEEFTLIIATNTDLGIEVPSLEISAEPWRLLNSLNERLEEVNATPTDIVRSLICDGHKSIDFCNYKITTGQSKAIELSRIQPITFVWGPPGTGKTQTLAKIALDHISNGNRVLMLSYSNVSVDGAIMRVHELSSASTPGTLVRYGYPRRKDLRAHEYLTSFNLAIRNHPDLLRERKELLTKRRTVERNSSEAILINKRINEIRKTLSDEEKEVTRKAKFVATTVSKAIVDSTIYNQDFDVVIFDEASMAYIPQIIFSASLAKKHFVCMGDFRQLPPIVQGNSGSLLNADIFQYCGISSAVDNGRNHKWLCMLNTQYRMSSSISSFASHTMYGGLLNSDEKMSSSRQAIIDHGPIVGHPIAFADLSGMMSVCTKTGDGSRVNVLSALISFSLAMEAARKFEVGIITPYHGQSRLLHAMARDAAEILPDLKPVTCATVHQFQGSEKDVIVYDAVDCYRMTYPGMLLTSNHNNYANRLFNVALTRAKGKFIGIANIDYLENKNLSHSLMFGKMIATQKRQSSCLSGKDLLASRASLRNDLMSFWENGPGNQQFLKDLLEAKHEIRIDIPNKPVADDFSKQLAVVLQTAKGRGIKVYLRAENEQTLPSALKSLAIENPYLANPLTLIDKRIVWFGMPSSDANFTSEGITLKTEYRPVIRFSGIHTAKSIYGLMEMGQTVDQSNIVSTDEKGNAITDTFSSYALANIKCPSCGKPMKMKKSKKGVFYLSCTGYPNCQEFSFIKADLVNEYLYRNGGVGQRCPRCKCSLEAKDGRYGLYIQCFGSQGHKYKLDEI